MKCKLCLKEKELIKKSHIIPDFMYRGIFDDNHFLIQTNLKNLKRISKRPSGMYDENILCKKCDNEVIGKFETYASRILLPKVKTKNNAIVNTTISSSEKGLKIIHFKNIDYKKFKLFLISILWRSHISEHPFFKVVKLGKHAEILRKMILYDDPMENNDYETCLMLLYSESIPIKSIIEPRYLKVNGNSSYIFLINRFMFNYNISNYNKLSFFEKTTIMKDNTMDIALLENEIANEYFDSFLGQKLRLKTQN